MHKILPLLVSVLFTSTIFANILDFPEAGFSINSIDAAPAIAGGKPLHMYLPPLNGYSANVSVLIQPYPGTMKQYLELTKSQFIQLGLSVVTSKSLGETMILEYAGTMQGKEFHFYAKAIKTENFVYLVTATDSKQNWSSNKAQLISAVDSFKLK